MKWETKRRKPATGRALMLLRLVARAINRGVLTNAVLMKLLDHDEREWASELYGDDHLPNQIMTLLRSLADGRRDPAVILGQKPRRGRKNNAVQRAAVIVAYWEIRRNLTKSKKPHADACEILRKQYPQWRYTDGTLRQWRKAAGPEGRIPPATVEDFDIVG